MVRVINQVDPNTPVTHPDFNLGVITGSAVWYLENIIRYQVDGNRRQDRQALKYAFRTCNGYKFYGKERQYGVRRSYVRLAHYKFGQ